MFRFLVVALLLACMAPSARADVVKDWDAIAQFNGEGKRLGPQPLRTQTEWRATALTALAMFEASNALDRRFVSYLDLPAASGGEPDIAAAAAAHTVLVALYPARRAVLDDALAISIAHANASMREVSLAVGKRAAEAALNRQMMGDAAVEPYRPADQIGRFAPPMAPIIQPWTLQARPFFLKNFDEVMPPPPPALTSARYAQSYNETKSFGFGHPNATPEALRAAQFFAGYSLESLIDKIASSRPRAVERARFIALLRMLEHDFNIAIGVAKMRYGTWRPFNAIRNGDRDDNPATERDPEWRPVLSTPNHPEYPCGHCTASALYAGVLGPEWTGPIVVGSESASAPVTVTFPTWAAFQEAASLSRIQGGVHFRFANEAGEAMGARIAALARERFAAPLNRRR